MPRYLGGMCATWLCTVLLLVGCRGRDERSTDGRGRIADVAGRVGENAGGAAAGTLANDNSARAAASSTNAATGNSPIAASLARAAGGPDGRSYRATSAADVQSPSAVGVVVGRIGGGERASRDTIISPTHDYVACEPFTQKTLPSTGDGVGNAIVWLVGVATGPADTSPKRVEMQMDGCRLEPRVQRVAVGGTLMVASHDRMMSRLRFASVADGEVHATILLNDAGQVVPSADAIAHAGLIEVRDDLHPWVRAWVAVAPHPFVAVTTADGQFRFDGVPPGRYSLSVWSEVLGTRTRELRVTAGVETRLDVKY